MTGQAAVQGQGHLPGGLSQEEGDLRQDAADLPHVVAVGVGEEHPLTGRSRSGDAREGHGLLRHSTVRAGEGAAQVQKDAGGPGAQLGDAPADLAGAPVDGESHSQGSWPWSFGFVIVLYSV